MLALVQGSWGVIALLLVSTLVEFSLFRFLFRKTTPAIRKPFQTLAIANLVGFTVATIVLAAFLMASVNPAQLNSQLSIDGDARVSLSPFLIFLPLIALGFFFGSAALVKFLCMRKQILAVEFKTFFLRFLVITFTSSVLVIVLWIGAFVFLADTSPRPAMTIDQSPPSTDSSVVVY